MKEYGLIHRDLKPSNIVLSLSGETKFIDFGSAFFHSKVKINAKNGQINPECNVFLTQCIPQDYTTFFMETFPSKFNTRSPRNSLKLILCSIFTPSEKWLRNSAFIKNLKSKVGALFMKWCSSFLVVVLSSALLIASVQKRSLFFWSRSGATLEFFNTGLGSPLSKLPDFYPFIFLCFLLLYC